MPLAVLVVMLMRLVRPFVIIRVGALKSDRIGHFVLETELMLLEQTAGIKTGHRRAVDLYYAPHPVSNVQIERMWRRVIRVWPRWLMIPVFRMNNFLPRSGKHVIPSATATCLDVHNLLDKSPALLHFSVDEVRRGRELQQRLGINDEEYVCVIARDASYYKMALPSQDLSYHDFRNWDINSYIGGLEALADEGPIVVRMGVVVDQALKSLHPRVIDYATSGYQSRFGDGWLGANFKFCISDGLGFFARFLPPFDAPTPSLTSHRFICSIHHAR